MRYFLFTIAIIAFLTACSGQSATPTSTAPIAQATTPATTEASPAPPTAISTTAPTPPPPTTTDAPPESPSPTSQPATPTVAPTETPVTPSDPSTIHVTIEPVGTGFSQPVGIVWAGDSTDRFYVVDQVGAIWVVEGGQRLSTPFLDLRGDVSRASEQGLLGLAFEPEQPDRFYVNYTDLNGTTRIVRYRTTSPQVADAASAEVILTVPQPAANHNGGNLDFGPDGYLWIGLGDGGAAGDRYQNGQNAQTWLGSMLRLDVSGESGYAIPTDNPFADSNGGAPEIWAIGLRNPWRYSFDRETGEIWIADVGQNQIEEVNRVPSTEAGLNYGWPIMEGQSCYNTTDCTSDNLVLPITQYTHSEGGCSITGGYVYRGDQFPALRGLYFFSDYCTGHLWAIAANAVQPVAPTIVGESGLSISAFGQDPLGELYLSAFDGTIYHLVQE